LALAIVPPDDEVRRHTPVEQHLAGVLAGVGRRPGHLGSGPTEARRRRGLAGAGHVDERLASDVVRVFGRLGHGEDRGEAHVRALHQRTPLVPGLAVEELLQATLEHGPQVGIHLQRELGVVRQPGQAQQLGVELGLDGPDRDVVAVGAPVDVVEVGAGVEQVLAPARLVEEPGLLHAPEHRHHHRAAVDHRRVDDLSLTAAGRLQQTAHDAERQQHPAAAEVADHVQGRGGWLAEAPEVREGAGQRDVVDVVSSRGGVGPLLPPSGHPAEDELRVAGQAHVGAGAHALHHPGTEALEEGVGPLDERQQGGHAVGVLQVEGDVAPPPLQDVPSGGVRRRATDGLRPLDPDDLRAHVGQHHRRERAGADPGQLEDADASQRPGHGCRPLRPRRPPRPASRSSPRPST
jgi:hypothetical protein